MHAVWLTKAALAAAEQRQIDPDKWK